MILLDADNHPHRLCLVTYYLPENFEPTVLPHGNSQQNKPYYPTLPSTMSAIKEQCLSGKEGPKQVVSEVSSMVGGVLCASDACELPRNEQQVSDLKQRQKKGVIANANPCDELAVVMQKAYLEESNQRFIREVKTLHEPGIVVAVDRQLDDLIRFCTDESQFGILTVDPTFSLGAFDVTVTTYRHLMLECRRTRNYPAFIGPVLIHFKKSFSTYLFFSSTLVGLRPPLSYLKSFGTDGELALYQAFKHSFPSAVHLLCSIHVRRNIKSKIQEMGITESVQQIILGDIFGKQVGAQYIEGLIDAENDQEYENGLQSLIRKWKALDANEDGPVCSFTGWFVQYKNAAVKEGLLRPNRQRAGLGDPPSQFTTNASESVNALLKNKMDYKKHELPVFLDKLKEVIDEQERELERAIIDRGKYKFCTDYQYLVKKQSDWFLKMSGVQRETHLKKVAKANLQKKANSNSHHSNLFFISSDNSDKAYTSHKTQVESSEIPHQSEIHFRKMPDYCHQLIEHQNQISTGPLNYGEGGILSRKHLENYSATFQHEAHSSTRQCDKPSYSQCSFESQDELSEDEKTALCSHHLEKSKSFQQEKFETPDECNKPTCSRRLFASQYQSLDSEDDHSLPGITVTSGITALCTTFNHSPLQTCTSFASHQYSSSVAASTKQSQSAILPSSYGSLLSVAVSDFSESVITPIEVLKAIWKKASELLCEPNSLALAPGQGDNARMVRSYSGSRPHLVTRKRSGQYACDDRCPNWRSLGICAHCVAAAEDNHELLLFVRWFMKAKKVPNITKLATTEMPAGRGRKGSRAPPKKRPKVQPESRIPFSVVSGMQSKHASGALPQTQVVSSPIESVSDGSMNSSMHTESKSSDGSAAVTMSIGSAEIVDAPGNLIMNTGQVNIHSPIATEVTYHNMPIVPPPPPPLIRCASTSPDSSPFTLAFITGNIRVCRGCRQRYPKPALAPLNLCVRHQEWQQFSGPSGDPQTRYGNVYYHCNIPCIRARWPQFNSSMLHIPPTILVQLLPSHTQYLSEHMPGRL